MSDRNILVEPMESLVDQIEEALYDIKAMPSKTKAERVARADYLTAAISSWRWALKNAEQACHRRP